MVSSVGETPSKEDFAINHRYNIVIAIVIAIVRVLNVSHTTPVDRRRRGAYYVDNGKEKGIYGDQRARSKVLF